MYFYNNKKKNKIIKNLHFKTIIPIKVNIFKQKVKFRKKSKIGFAKNVGLKII